MLTNIPEDKIESLSFADTSKAGARFNDLSETFKGYLFILGPSRSIRKNGEKLWLFYSWCLACGSLCERQGKLLNRPRTVSCGCVRLKSKQKKEGSAVLNLVFKKYLYHARMRKIPFRLSKLFFTRLVEADCYYCGSPPELIKAYYGGKHKISLGGIDRKDNSKAYTKENVVSCCRHCNRMKTNLSSVDFISQMIKIFYHRCK